jgi:hypothetical protein
MQTIPITILYSRNITIQYTEHRALCPFLEDADVEELVKKQYSCVSKSELSITMQVQCMTVLLPCLSDHQKGIALVVEVTLHVNVDTITTQNQTFHSQEESSTHRKARKLIKLKTSVMFSHK